MSHLIHIVEPFDLKQNQYMDLVNGLLLGPQLGIENDTDQFEHPSVVSINGLPTMRATWSSHIVKERDIIQVVTVQGGIDPFSLIIAVVVVALLAAATVLLLGSPSVPTLGASLQDTPEADPVFSLSGQQNKSKLGQSIEVGFGEFRTWPSFASNPYNLFNAGGEELLKMLFCVGEGFYQVVKGLVEDTPIENFSDASFTVYPPGTTVDAFHPNVETCAEIDNVELFAPNEPEHDSWGTSVVITTVDSLTDLIQFDVQTPRGLFFQEDNGDLTSLTVSYKARYRLIDDDGEPLGAYIETGIFSITAASVSVQRKTHDISGVVPGRYEFQAIRTDTKDTTTKAAHQLNLVRVKSFNQGGEVFEGQTIIAVEFVATNRINNKTNNRINFRCKRFMDVYNETSKTFQPQVFSDNPIDAIISLLREKQHGDVADESILFDELVVIRTELANEGIKFNWIFEKNASIRDVVNVIAAGFNGKVIVEGTDFTIWRDTPQAVAKAMWQPNNMVAKSFVLEISMKNAADSFDGIEIEYTNDKDWLPRTVLCVLADEDGDNPRRVRLEGVTNETQAFRLGMRIRSAERFERSNIRFSTDIEGFLPSFGDRIVVAHDVPRWAQFGRVISIDEANKLITIDHEVTFEDDEEHTMIIKTRLGAIHSAFIITDGGFLKISYASEEDFSDIAIQPNFEAPIFQIGNENQPRLDAKIVFMKSAKGGEQVQMTCTNYDERVYDFDAAFPP